MPLLLLGGCALEPDARIAAARDYRTYAQMGRAGRWAPWNCTALPVLKSASRDPRTHGRKLYFLFVRDPEAYLHARELDQPVGQVLVKESWNPGPGSTAAVPIPGRRGPLFLMMKTGEPGSDQGWIYATVAPDGATVTASGLLESCMDCHRSARRDRVFGPASCASPE